MGEAERGEAVPRHRVGFWCAKGHETRVAFATDAEIPELWDCPRCGLPAGQDRETPPPAPRTEPYKTHLAYVRERRSDADGDALLEEALNKLRARRG
jgi:hypothetical protein